MGRAPCCDKANVKKGPWSPEEDAKLKSYIEQQGTGGNWIALPQKIGLKRCGKSCRLRWLNYLRPNIKHGGFSEEEDRIICSLYVSIGSRWSIIAAQLPGRTDNDIKNYWNTRLKKKLFGKQRKEHQATRRGNALKQMQVKRENTTHGAGNSAIFSVSDGHNIPYWPELPVAPPQYNNDQAAIRKLLMKLGGRFSGDEHVLVNHGFLTTQPLLDQPAANMPSSSAINNPIENLSKFSAQFTEENLYNANGYGHLPFLQGQSSNMAELENYNMAYDDPRRVLCGLEFLYGDEMTNACRIATTTAASADQSCEMGSLINPSNYETMLQDLTEEYANYNELRISDAQ